MKTKTELLKELEERIGEHYFQCLHFCSILNLLRGEVKFSSKIEQKLDEVFELIKLEANKELKEAGK